MRRLLAAAAALLVGTPALASGPYRPCAHAAKVVSRDLVPGEGPAHLASRPLYELELTVTPDLEVSGREQVTYAAPTRGRVAILTLPAPMHLDGRSALEVTSVAAVVGAGDPKTAPFARGRGRITVTLPRAPVPGERVAVRLGLAGRLPANPPGLGGAFAGGLGGMGLGGTLVRGDGAATLLSPEALLVPWRDGHPWVVPEAPFGAPSPAPFACHLVTVDAPKHLAAVPSGVTVGTVPEANGRVRHVFVAAGRRVGIVLLPGPVHRVSHHAGSVTVVGVAKSTGEARRLARYAADTVATLVAADGALPWRRLTVTEGPIPGPVSGARVAGLVVVNSYVTRMARMFGGLARAASPSPAEMVVAHEVAHQWFGELIATPGPRAPVVEALLDQASTMEALRAREGAGAAATFRARFLVSGYRLYRIGGGKDAAADQPARALKTVAAWAGLCTSKAPGLFYVLDHRLGTGVVDGALGRLAEDHRFGYVDRGDLTGVLLAAAPTHIKLIRDTMRRWLDEAHGDADLGTGPPNLAAAFQGAPGMNGNGISAADLQRAIHKAMQRMLRQLQGGGP